MHVGLIGARGFGQHHLRGLQASSHVEAITLAGRDEAALVALRTRYSKVRGVATDYHMLLDDPSIDLIDVVVPHDLHLPIALEAFARGKHVIVEKPPARTPAEFRQMLAAAERAQRRLFVVMNLLYTPVHRAARAVVDSGALGRPFYSVEASVSTARGTYENPENWRADRVRCGGGLLIDGGFHGVYRQLYFLERLGAPCWLIADCAKIGVDAPTKGEDFCALTLAYPGGERVHLCNQWTAQATLGRFPSGILGTDGSLLFTGDPTLPLLIRRPERDDEPVTLPPGPIGFQESVVACVVQYVECVATGAAPYAGNDLALLTLEIITGAYRAAESGSRVYLDGSFRTAQMDHH